MKPVARAVCGALALFVAAPAARADESGAPRLGHALDVSAELSVDPGEGRVSGGGLRSGASIGGFGLVVGLHGRRLLESRSLPETEPFVSSHFAGSAALSLRLSPLTWVARRGRDTAVVDLYGEAGLAGGVASSGELLGSLPLSLGLDLRWPRAIAGVWPQLSIRYTHHAARGPDYMLADEVSVGLGVAVGTEPISLSPWH